MNNVELLTVNTIRILSAEAVQKANSGHPGLPMGAAPMAYTLWARNLKHNPANPGWDDRDRFILSAGHGSMLIYSLLHLFGYGLTIDDLKNFRQLDSLTPGHPEYGHTKGVEITTGPLGQGLANAVGMAMAEAYLANRFNRPGYPVVDHYTYVLSGDGCMMEGVASEAASLAGTLGLGKLIVLYDSNSITIEGSTDIAFREDVRKRFEAYGWHTLKVEDGTSIEDIDAAIKAAKAVKDKPSLIEIKTQIGYGSPKQGMASAHGEPLGAENVLETKKTLGWDYTEEFHVPDEVKAHMEQVRANGMKAENEWNKMMEAYKKEYPELAAEWESWKEKDYSETLLEDEDFWSYDSKANATRNSSGEVLNKLAARIPNLIGGSADLAPSNKSYMKNRGDFSREDRSGSNLHFGVREHAMAAIANGIAAHGRLAPYVATFFVFCDYMKPSMRLSALMKLPVTYILTHDSIGVGEDGPTHQPVEHLAALRSIPNFIVFRPCDAKETAAGWYTAMSRKNTPTALILTRQNLPQLEMTGKDALKGAYVILDSGKKPEIILMASGSEVHLVYEAGKQLLERGIAVRVVSMPSWELFEEQDEAYKESVFPPDVVKRLAVEAGASFGWHKYTGLQGEIISIDHFGESAPAGLLFKRYGFTVENVLEKALKLLNM
ncbi:MAG TPA: transketolase [Clostridiales bacterium]|nr:transketolase [Clostridiales bacterium]HPP34775.1 transketolase [Clostridiales bacterium]